MRFLTLNTHSWCEIHQIDKIRTLAQFIVDQQVDVIALQEVNQLISTPVVEHPLHFRGGAGIPVREDNYALLLVRALEALGARYEWTLTETHLGWERYDECVAVLSRMPIRGIRPIDMSPDYTYFQVQRRAAQAALIETPSGPFWCATTHMSCGTSTVSPSSLRNSPASRRPWPNVPKPPPYCSAATSTPPRTCPTRATPS